MLIFERRTIAPEEIDNGPLPARYLNLATVLSIVLLLLALFPLWQSFTPLQWAAVTLLTAFTARLLAIDLCYLLLPNLYIFPLLLIAPSAAPLFGHITWLHSLIGFGVATALGFAILFMLHLLKRPQYIGMGDIKFMALMGAWLGIGLLPLAMAVGCFIGLGLSFIVPRGHAFPFGPALIGGLWVTLFYATELQSLLIGLIRLIP